MTLFSVGSPLAYIWFPFKKKMHPCPSNILSLLLQRTVMKRVFGYWKLSKVLAIKRKKNYLQKLKHTSKVSAMETLISDIRLWWHRWDKLTLSVFSGSHFKSLFTLSTCLHMQTCMKSEISLPLVVNNKPLIGQKSHLRKSNTTANVFLHSVSDLSSWTYCTQQYIHWTINFQ